MDKSAKFALGFVDTWQKLAKRFMALPIILKILLSPLILVFSFTIFLPIIAVAAISYKGLKAIADTFIAIYRLRKSFIRIMRLVFIFSVLWIICLSLLMLVVILLFHLFPKFPAFLRWIVLAMSGYMIVLLYVVGKERNADIKNITEVHDKYDLEQAKHLIAEASGKNANRNPLVWLLSGSIRLVFAGAFLLSGGIVVLLLFSATLNTLIPGVFFKDISQSQYLVVKWLVFLGQELLKVIPIEFLSPFLAEVKTFDIVRPWGKVLMIFIQTGMTLLLYVSITCIVGAYKLERMPDELDSNKNA